MQLDFRTLDVFTDVTFGGNPLAVFPDAAHLPSELMQKIAREMNLSETVFLGPPETPEGTARVRIFTPEAEVPFAGHPTVGAAIHLAGTESIRARVGLGANGSGRASLLLEENVGPVPVVVRYRAGRPVFARFTTAMLPERRASPHPPELLAAMVGLEPLDVGGGAPSPLAPAMVSCGLPFHVVPVRTPAALRRAALNTALWRDMLAGSWAHHVYLVCPLRPAVGGAAEFPPPAGGRATDPVIVSPPPERTRATSDNADPAAIASPPPPNVRVRMFAPGSGVPEDPATGSAAAVLGGYLGDHDGRDQGTLCWRVAQGEEVGRPSLIEVEADRAGGRTTAIRVGGAATFVARGTMEVPGEPDRPRLVTDLALRATPADMHAHRCGRASRLARYRGRL